MVYKETLIPDQKNHTIEMPEHFFGKKVEMIIVELSDPAEQTHPAPPIGKEISVAELFENFGEAPDFPSAEEIRVKAWPSKW